MLEDYILSLGLTQKTFVIKRGKQAHVTFFICPELLFIEEDRARSHSPRPTPIPPPSLRSLPLPFISFLSLSVT